MVGGLEVRAPQKIQYQCIGLQNLLNCGVCGKMDLHFAEERGTNNHISTEHVKWKRHAIKFSVTPTLGGVGKPGELFVFGALMT